MIRFNDTPVPWSVRIYFVVKYQNDEILHQLPHEYISCIFMKTMTAYCPPRTCGIPSFLILRTGYSVYFSNICKVPGTDEIWEFHKSVYFGNFRTFNNMTWGNFLITILMHVIAFNSLQKHNFGQCVIFL